MAVIQDLSLELKAKLFRGLADPSRLAILESLRAGERTVSDVVAATGLSQPNASNYLACLRDCGLVTSRPQGRASMFSLATEPHLMELLGAAERLLAETGDAVDLCPTYGSTARRRPRAD